MKNFLVNGIVERAIVLGLLNVLSELRAVYLCPRLCLDNVITKLLILVQVRPALMTTIQRQFLLGQAVLFTLVDYHPTIDLYTTELGDALQCL